jgi:transmembrane sensor
MGEGEDLFQQIAAAGRRIDPGLSDRDVERLVAAARRRRDRRAAMLRAVLAAGAAGCLALIAAVAFHRVRHAPVAEPVAPAQAAAPVDTNPVLRLADGSTAAPLDPESQIDVVEDATNRVRLSLVRGRGRFEVVPRPQRAFVVRAGDVTVTVVGTVFTVERVADRVGVTVQRGTVRVDWKSGSTPVTAGQSGWFPPLVTAADKPAAPPIGARGVRGASTKLASGATARDGRGRSAAELLLDADRARLSGHPDEGVELLRKLLRDHPRDPRAPLAAFTLGRLLLVELGRPAEAATAFAQARQIAPAGPFAEDALAREVEALSNAGMAAAAQARARDYERLYPNGRRTETVRTAGGIK